jgi:hypothetical protein
VAASRPGATLGDQTAGRIAAAPPERLGSEVLELPGDHGEIMTAPDEYAAKLNGLRRRARPHLTEVIE